MFTSIFNGVCALILVILYFNIFVISDYTEIIDTNSIEEKLTEIEN